MKGSMSNELLLMRATVLKLRAERKVMHEMLTVAGIPGDVLGDGVRTCLIGRLAIAIQTPPVSNARVCTCPEGTAHLPSCPVWR